MAIVKMSKFQLFIQANDRERLLKPLQKFKYVHFHNLHDNEELEVLDVTAIDIDEQLNTIEQNLRDLTFAINTLGPYVKKDNNLLPPREGVPTLTFNNLEKQARALHPEPTFQQIKRIQSKKDTIEQKMKQYREEIEELTPWVSFDAPLSLLSDLKQHYIFTGTIPKKLLPRLESEIVETELTTFQTISEGQHNAYIMVLAHHSKQDEAEKVLLNHGFSRRKMQHYEATVEEEMTQLTNSLENLHSEWEVTEDELTELSNQIDDFKLLHDYYLMEQTRIKASENFLQTKNFAFLQGYIPTKDSQKFEKILQKHVNEAYFLQVQEVEENDPDVPTLLENNKLFKPFESVTEMFALPRYNEIDPTPWFTVFYALFFGMMIGDAGYGIILLIATWSILKFWKLKKNQQTFIQFFYYLSFSTILWGLIYGSFFGDILPLPALINATEEYTFLLVLSIALGGIHIFFALAINAYMSLSKGKFLDAIYDVGFWYMAIGGGIVYLLALLLPAMSDYQTTALTIMLIGMVGILLTGGRENKTIGGKLAGGLYSLYGITGYVGDFVSYSRLMALGLSSAFIAFAINLMVSMLFDLGIIGIIAGTIVFVVGQGFNLFLSILSSYVHTLRLTYVEFFGKFYEGGGKAFQTYRSKSKYIDIK